MKKLLLGVACGVALLVFAPTAFAETFPGVADEAVQAALSDLSEVYGSPVVRIDQAKAICNEEQYLADCAKIGTQHGFFSGDRAEQVDTVLSELKGDTVEKFKQCTDVACLIEVATSIAGRLNREHPAIARAVELTPSTVREKRDIVETAASLGIDIDACRTMDPDTAPIELLRSCARLAKHENIQKYLPEEARGRAEANDQSLALKESLAAGEYQCGDGTLESCGTYCLNPSAEARTEGTSAIPGVCRQLAERFFGPTGVAELEKAYTSVQNTYDTFAKRAKSVAFTTIDGRTLTNMAEIGRYIEEAGRQGNVEAVEAGMDFLAANGFVSVADRGFALAMVKRIGERGAVDFDQCRAHPESCADIVPPEEQGQFKAMGEIEQVMRNEMASRGITDPSRCASDPSIGEACMAAARAALQVVEGDAERSSETNSIIASIRRQVSFGEEAIQMRTRVEDHFRAVGDVVIGENQFRSIADLEAFCQANPHQCLAETTRAGFISRDAATDRYEYSAAVRHTSSDAPSFSQTDKDTLRAQFEAWLENPNQAQSPYPTSLPYPQPYPYPYPDPGRATCPYGQSPPQPCPAGEYRQESLNELGCSLYSACIPFNTETQRPPGDDSRYTCPALPTVDSCPSGQERRVSFISPECGTYYICANPAEPSTPTPTPSTDCSRWGAGWHGMDSGGNCFNTSMTEYRTPGGSAQLCSSAPVYGCGGPNTTPPSGSQREQVWNSLGLRSWIRADAGTARIASLKQACSAVPSSANIWMPGAGNYSSADFGMPDPDKCGRAAACTTSQYFDGTSCVTGSTTGPGTSCPSGQYWNGSVCVNSTSTSGCGSYNNQTNCVSAPERCDWRTSGSTGWCQAGSTAACGNYICESGEATSCSADCATYPSSSCPSGQYWNGTACAITSSTDCPSGWIWNGNSCIAAVVPPSGGCASDQQWNGVSCVPIQTTAPSCPSGQYWNGSSCVASNSTITGSCSSTLIGLLGDGCHSMGNAWFNSGMTQYVMPGGSTVAECTIAYLSGCTTGGSTATSCSSGQYWNGNACVTSSSTTCPSGQYWAGSACVNFTSGGGTDCSQYGSGWHTMDSSGNCFDSLMQNYKTTNGTLYSCASTPASGCSPSSSQSCSSNQYWDGSTCVSSSPTPSTSCSSGQYWNGSTCVTTSYTDCPSGQYWDGSTCVSSSPTPSTSCPSGQYWNGSACETPPSPPTSSLFCPSGHDWNGSYCNVAAKSVFERYSASVISAFLSLMGL